MLNRLREEGGVLVDIPEGFKNPAPQNATAPGTQLFADAEFPNDSLVALGIVSLEVVQ
jgi:hypothetical protein